MLPRMISYAGNHEDVLLRRAFVAQPAGFFIDIGAHHPIHGSITKHLSDIGWRGINIEPMPCLFTEFPSERPHDINLNVAASNFCGKAELFEVEGDLGLSTLSNSQANEYGSAGRNLIKHIVEVETLASICERHVKSTIDLLSIDVEGHERAVLEGADFNLWRPRVVLIEAVKPWSTSPTHEEWEPILIKSEYHLVLFDGVNRVYVRNEENVLDIHLSTPVNIIDNYVDYKIVLLERELRHCHAYLHCPANLYWWLSLPGRALRRIQTTDLSKS